MGVCSWCNQEMTDQVGCTTDTVTFRDGVLPSIRYGDETRYDDSGKPIRLRDRYPTLLANCHDCGTPLGSFHHPGCDVEECPRCHGQLISCEDETV